MKKTTIFKLCAIIAVVLLFIMVKPLNQGFREMLLAFKDVESVKVYIRSFGVWAIGISFLMMILQSVAAPIPAFVVTFANAAIWGWQKGAIISWTSAMAGAALCFYISRFYGRAVTEKFASKGALKEVDVFFDRYGKNAIFIARLLPFMPFDPISYAAGLTSMSFGGFFLATGLGQLPATIIYSYAAAKSSNPSTFIKGLLILFAVTALVFTVKKIWTEKQTR